MFDHYPDIILHDDMLEELVDKGCRKAEDGLEGSLGNCLGHYYICLAGFIMKVLSHRRDQNTKKGLRGINICGSMEE